MADNNIISIKTNPKYGFNLTRTTFDTHQEISAKVIGVLKYNNDIRDRLLKRNIGSYEMVEKPDGIGYISNLYSFETSKPLSLGEEGLLGYTHVLKSDYQEKINQRYGIGDFITYYRTGALNETNNWKWKGLYEDYTKFIDETFGLHYTSLNLLSDLFNPNKNNTASVSDYNKEKSLTIQSILNDFLQYDNIKYVMEQTRIGTVRPNPLAALAGSITTNINNFSGTDTPLGVISNQLYAHALRNGAQFNTLRRTPYITWGVYESIGNKLSTIATLDSDNKIDPDTGRLAFEFGDGVGIRTYESLTLDTFEDMDMIDATRDIADSRNARYNNIISNIDRYMPFYGHQYSPVADFATVLGSVSNVLYNKEYRSWNEGDKGNWTNDVHISDFNNTFINIDNKSTSTEEKTGLLEKTQNLFTAHDEKGIDTLIGRFHTSGGRDTTHNEASLLQTAVSKYGMSHGRNLLHKQAYERGNTNKTNGYENPYCRVWTYHHQYNKISNLVRPFTNTNSDGTSNIMGVDELQRNWWQYGRRAGSAGRLRDNSTLNGNGFVNITPTNKQVNSNKAIDIKKCMFSIENLAWKNQSPFGSNYATTENVIGKSHYGALSPEQRGPNGGRIMWFPPYDLKFNEQVGVNWNPVDFIGRGEKIYTYTNTERTGTLSFTLLVDHPSILDMWKKNSATGIEEDDEQKLLRFFAGCDTLELDNVKIQQEDEQPAVTPIPQEDVIPIEENKTDNNIIFYVFFPNNYSGIEDFYENIDKQFDSNHINNVVHYLTTMYETIIGAGSSNGKLYENYDWQYRVDKKYIEHELENEGNYKDSNGFGLNTSKDIITSNSQFSDATDSFKDISGCLIDKIKEKGNKINYITVKGYASSHGYTDINNNILSRDRARMIAEWISETLKGQFNFDEKLLNVETGGEVTVDTNDINNVSGESAKRARCVKVVINVRCNENIITPLNAPLNTFTKDTLNVNENLIFNTNTQLTKKQKRVIKKSERKIEHQAKKIYKEYIKNGPNETILEEQKKVLKQDIAKSTQQEINTKFLAINSLRNGAKLASAEQISENRKKLKQKRWDEEAQYFEMLEANDSFTYTRLVDKIKYFTPAFHSITPEGFNARLAFLHQCTRQGSTIGTSDGQVQRSSGNMAFGRPPICVLRIGDFFNTRILISSVSIDYEDVHWDMNPEGIGMQPMLAKISLNITYLGGSSLEAPISRLQNAVSFNYYANQEVYDDRSDIGIYDNANKKAIIKGKPWLPNYEFFPQGGEYIETNGL